ncbi:Macrolide export ATP-binding/permease protein MacB [Minicystis rosea]|nr:Macrolide export ATP-binding/permease protein MacB [Minicystis rosea]
MIWLILRMALQAIAKNGLRSALTTLGIVIGVSAVIAMVTLGQGATQRITGDIEKMGSNLLTLFATGEKRGATMSAAQPFKMNDAKAIAKEVSGVRLVAPAQSRSMLVVAGSRNRTTQVDGSTPQYFDVRGFVVQKGRVFEPSEADGGAPVAVLGAAVAKELFPSQEPLGATIRIGRLGVRVIGVLEPKGGSALGMDPDDFVAIPLSTFQRRISGNHDITLIYVGTTSDKAIPRVKSGLEALMRERRRLAPSDPADFMILDMKEIAKTLSSVTTALTALLGAIAAVSLLVGGIGIMNIMLVSVTERTREIGIRLAIGAEEGDVLVQFLVEAVALSLGGGALGVALGIGGSFGLCRALELPFQPSPSVVLVGFGFSAFIGVVFGYFPARKAARLVPIEALRHE